MLYRSVAALSAWLGSNSYQLSTRYLNARLRYCYFRFLKTNGRRIEILLPVSILTFSLSPACDSASFKELVDCRRSYDVILVFQNGGHSVANLLPVSVWWHFTFKKTKNCMYTEFRQDTSIQSWDITTSGFWKQMADILQWYFRFRFWPFTVVGMWFCFGIPIFIRIGSSEADVMTS